MSFLQNIEWRRAEKTFSTVSVDENELFGDYASTVQHAMINAPSSFGVQPYHIIAVKDMDTKKRLQEVSYNQSSVTECHTLFILCARTDLTRRVEDYINKACVQDFYSNMMRNVIQHKNVEWSARQAYIALGYGLAACTELKIASCPMEGFESDKVKTLLNLPSHLEPYVYLAIGKKSDTSSSHERFRFSDEDMVTKI